MKKILIIRRDNIGDLVCTTPVFEAIKARYPDASIHALVNSYNSAVLEGNPHVSEIHVYEKLKHRINLFSIPLAILRRLRLMLTLRSMNFDYAIVAGAGFQPRVVNYLRWIRPVHAIGYVPQNHSASRVIDQGLPTDNGQGLHEVEAVFRLLTTIDIRGTPSKVKVYPNKRYSENSRTIGPRKLCVGVHISSRKPSQRWPAERFVEFIRYLRKHYDARVVLLWSPGTKENRNHPGDDGKANTILTELNDASVVPLPTLTLRDLIDRMTEPDLVVCSDGGAMHIAAGLGKPILCFFGDSDDSHWHPWGVPHELLQAESHLVADISTAEAVRGFEKLFDGIKHENEIVQRIV
jgi:heptosyltransferase III